MLRAAGWMTGSHLLAQTFAYGSLILLARWLTPTSFGTLAVGTAIVYVAVLFVDHGTLGGLIVRQSLTRTDLLRAFRRCLLTACALAAAMATTAGIVVTHFASGGDAAAVAALALCLPLHALSVVPTALLQKAMRFRTLAGLNAAANTGSAMIAVLLAAGGAGVWALVARQLVLFAVLAAATPVWGRRELRDPTSVCSPGRDRTPGGERWFFLFGVALMVTANLDFLTIGATSDAHLVGLYALAFTIAMAPSTHISEQVGRVLFAAAALQPDNNRQRTELSVRLMSMLFVPLLPVAVLAAPMVLPAVLGAQWEPMVVPFQVLLIVGVGHAVVNCIGETLSGNGHIAFRAKVMMIRCAATLLLLLVLVPADGIRGAAFAQLLVFLAYAGVYVGAGARRAGTSPRALAAQLRPVAAALLVQVGVGTAAWLMLTGTGVASSAAAPWAAIIGLISCLPVLYRLGLRGLLR
ncbi:Membrane protein involved in the export of O-antigen and teichoic acid [Mycolicibacterium rutilum]|uniref:Membrane protein involved in the export of O-antigen and teichoic acid n=1 Tax=Mycolicibacterium rutilum TaxID=370526 RepID=A0A1H6IQH7_MYCRU|nr:Membrane protein involved in the export of O-antigen and teichoic acid [Mycolicibacterium rutilum]